MLCVCDLFALLCVTHCQFVPQVPRFIVPRFTQCPFTSVLLSVASLHCTSLRYRQFTSVLLCALLLLCAALRVWNSNVIWQLHSLLLHVIWNTNVIWQLQSVLNVIWQLHSVLLHVIWNSNGIWDRTMALQLQMRVIFILFSLTSYGRATSYGMGRWDGTGCTTWFLNVVRCSSLNSS